MDDCACLYFLHNVLHDRQVYALCHHSEIGMSVFSVLPHVDRAGLKHTVSDRSLVEEEEVVVVEDRKSCSLSMQTANESKDCAQLLLS